jgi:hypothetical protein
VRAYLDTRDLIVLVEKRSLEATATFEEKLRRGSSQLVFSMHNIMEYCAPPVQSCDGSNVMSTLNRLEQLPHLYIAEARIEALELQEGGESILGGTRI